VLEIVAKGDSLPEILDSVLVEEQASGVLASILLLDGNRLRSKLITPTSRELCSEAPLATS